MVYVLCQAGHKDDGIKSAEIRARGAEVLVFEPGRQAGCPLGRREPKAADAVYDKPTLSVISGELFPPDLLADQLVEHLLGPVLGFERLVQISEGGDDLKPPLWQGNGYLRSRVRGNSAGLEEPELAAGSGGVFQHDLDGHIQVVVHARPRFIQFIQIGLVVGA